MSILPSLIPNPFRGGLLPRIAAWWRRRRVERCEHDWSGPKVPCRHGRSDSCVKCRAIYCAWREGEVRRD